MTFFHTLRFLAHTGEVVLEKGYTKGFHWRTLREYAILTFSLIVTLEVRKMNAIFILTHIVHQWGSDGFAYSFSAKSIHEEQKISVYKARKHLQALRELGLIQRQGNVYMFTWDGWNITNDIIKAAQKYTMFKAKKGE